MGKGLRGLGGCRTQRVHVVSMRMVPAEGKGGGINSKIRARVQTYEMHLSLPHSGKYRGKRANRNADTHPWMISRAPGT